MTKINLLLISYFTASIGLNAQIASTENDSIDIYNDGEQIESVVLEGYRDKSDYVSKMPIKNIENPQVYSTVSENLLKQQVTSNYDDAMKNIPGVKRLWQSTGRGVSNGSYYSVRGFSIQPTMLNGLPGLTSGYPDPANIERIEVIKGPSGTLFGSQITSYGGLINIVTKKPKDEYKGEISYTLGDNTLNRFSTDVNVPLDKAGKWTSRFVGAFHTEDNFQDYGFNRSYMFAPSFKYQPSDRLSITLLGQISDSKMTNPTMFFLDRENPLTFKNINDFNYDRKKSYTSDDITLENPTFNVQSIAEFKISKNWTSQTVLQMNESKSKGVYSYLYEDTKAFNDNLSAGGLSKLSNGSSFIRYMSDQNTTNTTYDFQQNFNGKFKIGSMKNRLLVGLDFYHNTFKDASSNYITNGAVYIGNDDPNQVNKALNFVMQQNSTPEQYAITGSRGDLTTTGINQLFSTTPYTNTSATTQVYSTYVSDILNITPSLSISGGLRLDHFEGQSENSNQTTLSPRMGINYQVIPKKLAIFSSYMNGFQNTAPRPVYDQNGNNGYIKEFKPEQANQFELGIKSNLIDRKMVSSLSFYHIKVSDQITTDPNNLNSFIQGGEVISKGVELDIRANPIRGLDMIIGYSFNDSKIEKTDNDDIRGKRPLEAGADHLFNFWVNYTLNSNTILNGLGFGLGGNYSSKYDILNYTSTGDLTLPSEFILNTSVSYSLPKVKFNIKINNLTNREYFTGWTTLTPQMKRRILGSVSFLF